jgi:hypothetical protein
MNRIRVSIPLALTLIALFGAILSCNFDETEQKAIIFSQYYKINSESLLDSLKTGETDVFSKVDEQPEHVPQDQQIAVNWTQTDYLYIASLLDKYVLGEALADWQLNRMGFTLGCPNSGVGFQTGDFEFFKVTKKQEREARTTLFINIDPRSNFIYVSKSEYYPKLVDWTSIDLATVKVTANNALQRAENNGGRDNRLSVNNACEISLGLAPDAARYKGWRVSYIRNDNRDSLFLINIDPQTGEIHFP